MSRYKSDALLQRLEHGSCVGKKMYFSQREADDKAALSSRYSGEKLVGYQCPFCRLYHMGHPKRRERLEVEPMLQQHLPEVGKYEST